MPSFLSLGRPAYSAAVHSPSPFRSLARAGLLALGLACVLAGTETAHAQESARLLATSGVSTLEGAAGGGLATWSVISGYGTRDAIGANLHATGALTGDFGVYGLGASAGFYDRIELSYSHLWFDTKDAGGRLGLGNGYQFHLDTVGAKLRLAGNLVYDQDSWLPQLAIGVQAKAADQHAVLKAIGAQSPDGVDFYASATKLFLAQSLLLNTTLRMTKANQFGLLGFGGDKDNAYSPQVEASAAYLLSRKFAIGAEIRTKPDNLGFAREGNAYDIFAAYFINKHVSATLAFVALGPVARQGDQNGAYLSLQTGF